MALILESVRAVFSTVIVLLASVAGAEAGLDAQGRAMLEPARDLALKPDALVAWMRLRPTDVVADVGAGPGYLTLPLARAVPRGRVVAGDVRPDYLAVAARRAREAGLGNVETQVWPKERPGLAPRSIDVAVLCQVDAYLPDRARYLAELARALRPGGRIVVVNQVRYRAAVEAAARAAGLVLEAAWAPSPPYFALMLRATGS